MPLTRNSQQGRDKSLEGFYQDLKDSNNAISEKTGNDMLEFIKMVNDSFQETELWGLTSLSRLVIQAKDRWDAEWFVIVNSIGSNEYYFEYLMPMIKNRGSMQL